MLWGITSYFNPAGFKSRLGIYRTFKQKLRVPLIAVELSYNGKFELEDSDADIVVRRTGRDVLWQKERLLNIGLRSLPSECDAVAWLDSDVVFANENWPAEACAALEKSPIIQLFSVRCNLARGATENGAGWAPVDIEAPSTGFALATGDLPSDDLSIAGGFTKGRSTTGLAWAARRSLLDRHGLYDAHILGAGDRAMACAAIGRMDSFTDAVCANDRMKQHYRAWGEPFFADVAGRLGYVDGKLFHFWHGDVTNRRYAIRHREFVEFGFDPFNDIALDANGCWEWNSTKPAMHQFMRDYFAIRREDG